MRQVAPDPDILRELVEKLSYRPGWTFVLEDIDRGQGSEGLTLSIYVQQKNSYPPHDWMRVVHYVPVPPAAFNVQSWRRWLLERILEIERHEACEFFQIDGDRPYAPHHGPGNDPYIIFEVGSDEERRTSFRGDVTPAEEAAGGRAES